MLKKSDFRPSREYSEALPAERRTKIKARAKEIIEATQLAELRKSLEVTQTEVARRTGMRQSEISRLERAPDTVQIRNMERYAAGIGGQMKLVVEFPDGTTAEVPFRNGRVVKSKLRTKRPAPEDRAEAGEPNGEKRLA